MRARPFDEILSAEPPGRDGREQVADRLLQMYECCARKLYAFGRENTPPVIFRVRLFG